MAVTFKLNQVEGSTSTHETLHRVIARAIEVSRPIDEPWSVTTRHASDSAIVTVDLARGIEEPRSLSFVLEDEDVDETALYRIMCQFLRMAWPGGLQPST